MFTFKQFSVDDALTAMKVGTDGVLLGAWAAGGKRILDIGTGSGLIALMMAQRFPEAEIVGIDIDEDACRQARMNADSSPFGNRITIVHASLQDYVKTIPGASFDSIVSNPPYFQNSLKSPDSKRTSARHNDSLSFRDLITGSKALLKHDCTLSIIGPDTAENDIESEAIINGMTVSNIVRLKTKSTKQPSRFMMQIVNGFTNEFSNTTEVLNEADGSRSEWYHELTKNFYIK